MQPDATLPWSRMQVRSLVGSRAAAGDGTRAGGRLVVACVLRAALPTCRHGRVRRATCESPPHLAAALLQEKKSWLEKLRVAEAEAQRCRSEAAQLRLQQLQVGPGPVSTNSSSAAEQALQQRQQQQGREEQLLQSLLEAQAAEAALRAVLSEAREEQVAACRALSAELRRVHALERLRISEGGVGAIDVHGLAQSSLQVVAASSATWLSPQHRPHPLPTTRLLLQATWPRCSGCSAACWSCSASAASCARHWQTHKSSWQRVAGGQALHGQR